MTTQTKLDIESIREKRQSVTKDYKYDLLTLRITSPGKFEGEPIFAPYYWDIALSGFADSDNGQEYGFRFTNDGEDFQIWPELKKWLGRKRSLKLVEDSQGFVHCL